MSNPPNQQSLNNNQQFLNKQLSDKCLFNAQAKAHPFLPSSSKALFNQRVACQKRPRQAMILAAGEGRRMHPLTKHTPKPLLCVAGKPLIVWHIERLIALGIDEIVINVCYLADQMAQFFATHRFNANIRLSFEHHLPNKLETAGGVKFALAQGLLRPKPFVLINGDVWCNSGLNALCQPLQGLAYLLLVDNPSHNQNGDFVLDGERVMPKPVLAQPAKQPMPLGNTLTFAGLSLLSPNLFDGVDLNMPSPLGSLLLEACQKQQVHAQQLPNTVHWVDVGTPERLGQLNAWLAMKDSQT